LIKTEPILVWLAPRVTPDKLEMLSRAAIGYEPMEPDDAARLRDRLQLELRAGRWGEDLDCGDGERVAGALCKLSTSLALPGVADAMVFGGVLVCQSIGRLNGCFGQFDMAAAYLMEACEAIDDEELDRLVLGLLRNWASTVGEFTDASLLAECQVLARILWRRCSELDRGRSWQIPLIVSQWRDQNELSLIRLSECAFALRRRAEPKVPKYDI